MAQLLPLIDAETLICLASAPQGLGLSALARITGRSVSSVQRSLARLAGSGVIVRDRQRFRPVPSAPWDALQALAAWSVPSLVRGLQAGARQEGLRTAFVVALADPATARRVRALARRYAWWQPTSVTLRRPERLVAQVMADGTWDDTQTILGVVGEAGFSAVLDQAPAGAFDRRSWAYWHARLGRADLPPLPRRAIA